MSLRFHKFVNEIKNNSIKFSNSCEMDTKIEINEEDTLPENIASHNEMEFFSKFVAMKTNNDAMLLDDDCDMVNKRKVKSETLFQHICSQTERECYAKHEKQIKSENITSSNNYEIDMKTEIQEQILVSDFASRNKRELLPEALVVKVKKYNSDYEMGNTIEIKEEPCWLKIETSAISNDIKDENFPPVKSRLCTNALAGDNTSKSPLLSDEVPGRDTDLYNENVHPGYEIGYKEHDVSETSIVKEHFHSKQPGNMMEKCSAQNLYLKQKNFAHKGEKQHKCNICVKNFTQFSSLKRHNLIHEGKKPYQCKTCDKSFSRLSDLKTHNLIHEGKKPHQCTSCGKSFTQLSNLKMHSFIHEGKKPFKCKTCDKNFARFSGLKMHNLIHEGKKPHACKFCDKSFTQLSTLKAHNLIHEGQRPYQCKICDKSFTRLSNLKRHNLIHDGKKPYQCKTCDKSFTQLSSLKRHSLIHQSHKVI